MINKKDLKTTRVSVRMTETMRKRLKKAAEHFGISDSSLLTLAALPLIVDAEKQMKKGGDV